LGRLESIPACSPPLEIECRPLGIKSVSAQFLTQDLNSNFLAF
jgi:hypothetical protein